MANLDLQHLLATEHNGWLSLTNGTAADFYDSLMADDGVMVLAGGMVLDKEQTVASLREAQPWGKYTISEPQVVPLNENCAALVYRANALRAGEDTFRAIMTSVYRLERGGLRLAVYQQTVVTH